MFSFGLTFEECTSSCVNANGCDCGRGCDCGSGSDFGSRCVTGFVGFVGKGLSGPFHSAIKPIWPCSS